MMYDHVGWNTYEGLLRHLDSGEDVGRYTHEDLVASPWLSAISNPVATMSRKELHASSGESSA